MYAYFYKLNKESYEILAGFEMLRNSNICPYPNVKYLITRKQGFILPDQEIASYEHEFSAQGTIFQGTAFFYYWSYRPVLWQI